MNGIMAAVMVPMKAGGANTIDLSGKWDTLWAGLVGGTEFGKITGLLGVIGVAIVAMALIKWAWDRRRGGGAGQSGAVWGALLVGALLSAPDLIIPILLTILDVIGNAVISVWNKSSAG